MFNGRVKVNELGHIKHVDLGRFCSQDDKWILDWSHGYFSMGNRQLYRVLCPKIMTLRVDVCQQATDMGSRDDPRVRNGRISRFEKVRQRSNVFQARETTEMNLDYLPSHLTDRCLGMSWESKLKCLWNRGARTEDPAIIMKNEEHSKVDQALTSLESSDIMF